MARTSPRAAYNIGVRWIAANSRAVTIEDGNATRMLAAMFDVKPLAVARHVWLVRNERVTEARSFPLPKALTPPKPKKTRWIG